MRRTAGVCVGVLLLGMVAVPAWANHSTSTGINCEPDFTYQEDAQDYFNAHPGDPEGLDGPIGPTPSGIPNVACEDLPRRPVQNPPAPGPTPTTTTVPAGDTRIISITPAPAIAQGFLERTG